nr:hypothetical protein [Tanacetum cinerariifolium]
DQGCRVLLGNDGGGSWGDVRSGGSGEEWGKCRLQAWWEKGKCTVVLKRGEEQGCMFGQFTTLVLIVREGFLVKVLVGV